MKPGSYREPLIKGLDEIDKELATAVREKKIKLAVAASICGAVKIRKDLSGIFIRALELKSEETPDITTHYIKGLKSGRIVPVVNDIENTSDRYYAPGELFFTT